MVDRFAFGQPEEGRVTTRRQMLLLHVPKRVLEGVSASLDNLQRDALPDATARTQCSPVLAPLPGYQGRDRRRILRRISRLVPFARRATFVSASGPGWDITLLNVWTTLCVSGGLQVTSSCDYLHTESP